MAVSSPRTSQHQALAGQGTSDCEKFKLLGSKERVHFPARLVLRHGPGSDSCSTPDGGCMIWLYFSLGFCRSLLVWSCCGGILIIPASLQREGIDFSLVLQFCRTAGDYRDLPPRFEITHCGGGGAKTGHDYTHFALLAGHPWEARLRHWVFRLTEFRHSFPTLCGRK